MQPGNCAVTGDPGIQFADGHVSCYRPGDYLHRHNDYIDEKAGDRSAGDILNLTPVWQAEWGGAAEFPAPGRPYRQGLYPTWNALNMLQVGQMHFVGAVAPFVTAPRLSVSGWVRRR